MARHKPNWREKNRHREREGKAWQLPSRIEVIICLRQLIIHARHSHLPRHSLSGLHDLGLRSAQCDSAIRVWMRISWKRAELHLSKLLTTTMRWCRWGRDERDEDDDRANETDDEEQEEEEDEGHDDEDEDDDREKPSGQNDVSIIDTIKSNWILFKWDFEGKICRVWDWGRRVSLLILCIDFDVVDGSIDIWMMKMMMMTKFLHQMDGIMMNGRRMKWNNGDLHTHTNTHTRLKNEWMMNRNFLNWWLKIGNEVDEAFFRPQFL